MISQPKTKEQIEAMRQGGQILAQVLDLMESQTQAGISGQDLAQMAADEIKGLGAEPAFLGFSPDRRTPPFPAVICISISEQVQHGVPSKRELVDGDVVNYDCGVKYRGLITDAGRTIAVGKIGSDAQRLLSGTQSALKAGLAQVRAGQSVFNVSAAIERTLKKHRLGIVQELVGHGVGQELHELPEIPNYQAAASDYRLIENQTIAVEPIATLGTGQIYLDDDRWTLVAADGQMAAHFEHTVLVTATGCEILTAKH